MKLAYNGYVYESANKPWNNFNLIQKDKLLDSIKIGFEFEFLITQYGEDASTNKISQEDFDELVYEQTNEMINRNLDHYLENEIYRGDGISYSDLVVTNDDSIIPYHFLEDIMTESIMRILRSEKVLKNEVYSWRKYLEKININGQFVNYIDAILEIVDIPELTNSYDYEEDNEYDFGFTIDFYKTLIKYKKEITNKLHEIDKNQINLFHDEGEFNGELLNFFNKLIMDYRYNGEPNSYGVLHKDLNQAIIDMFNIEIEEDVREDVSSELYREYTISNSQDNNVYENIGAELVELFDNKFGYVVDSSHYNINNEFNVADDGSIEPTSRLGGYSCEISTPAIKGAANAEAFLIKMLNYIDSVGYANNSCGLHIGINNTISSKDKENWLKIAVLFQNDKFATMFNRLDNTYTKSLNDSLFRFINDRFSNPGEYKVEDIPKYEMEFKANREKSEKRRSINFLNNNYYEFRVLGGKDYPKRSKEIVSSMYSFAKIIEVASTNQYDEEYKKLLFKIINRGLKGLPSGNDNNISTILKTVLGLSKELPEFIDNSSVRNTYHRITYAIATELNNRLRDKSININGIYSVLKYLENKGVNKIALRLIELNVDFRRENEISRNIYS